MPKNPKTVLKKIDKLQRENQQLSDALGTMLDEAARAGRRAEYWEDRARGGQR